MTGPEEMWDRRYAEHPWPSEPDPLLVELAGALPAGRGLDLGSGPGRNSLWLAAKGWDMTLLDASGVALAQAEERAEQAGVHIDAVHGDVLGWRPDAPNEPPSPSSRSRRSSSVASCCAFPSRLVGGEQAPQAVADRGARSPLACSRPGGRMGVGSKFPLRPGPARAPPAPAAPPTPAASRRRRPADAGGQPDVPPRAGEEGAGEETDAQRLARQQGVTADCDLVLTSDPRRLGIFAATRYVLRIRTNLVLIAAGAAGYFFLTGVRPSRWRSSPSSTT